MHRISALFLLLLLQGCLPEGEIRPSKALNQDTTFLEYRVVLPDEGWIKSGQPVVISLRYPYSLIVTGSPYIEVELGEKVKRFYYNSGSGTEAINFRYIVEPTDYDSDGIVVTKTIELNGGTLEYTNHAGLERSAPLTLAPPATVIKVDGSLPVITAFTEPTTGRYSTGQFITYEFTFSEKVFVSGDVSFNIVLDSGAAPVPYYFGSGTNKLIFRKEILNSGAEFDVNGFSTNLTFNQNLVLNRAIRDTSGNAISSEIPAIPTVSVVNTPGPIITSIGKPADATYVLGNTLDFLITYDQSVDVTGYPAMVINLTTGPVFARYLSGSGTNVLTFRHTIISGEQDLNGIVVEPFLQMNGGTIKEVGSSLSAVTVFASPATPLIRVSAFEGPSIFQYILPKPKTYTAGDVLEFTIAYNRKLFLMGSPVLTLFLNDGPRSAAYVAPPMPSYNLVFQYTVQASDVDLDGITLRSPIVSGGTITDTNGIPAILVFTTPDATGIKISN